MYFFCIRQSCSAYGICKIIVIFYQAGHPITAVFLATSAYEEKSGDNIFEKKYNDIK